MDHLLSFLKINKISCALYLDIRADYTVLSPLYFLHKGVAHLSLNTFFPCFEFLHHILQYSLSMMSMVKTQQNL